MAWIKTYRLIPKRNGFPRQCKHRLGMTRYYRVVSKMNRRPRLGTAVMLFPSVSDRSAKALSR